mmetsp:Transcript_9337/g.12693  ORF Transcript_9337/g.12693 Transcript_9337/m.12693 type:complete len:272 (-) Transcript_9337:2951-3766(-)
MRAVAEPPDWYMFFGVLAAGCALILMTVFIIGYIANRDWRQKTLPKVAYKDFNYTAVERSDVQDKRAIVSINAEAESFTIRHMGREDDDEEELDIHMDEDAKRRHRKKKRRKTKDLQLPEVEHLKDRLQKHLIEIQKLVGRKYANEDDLLTDDEDENFSSDDEVEQELLNNQITELKRMLGANENIIKGIDNEDDYNTNGDLDGLDTLGGDGDRHLNAEDKKKKQREADARQRKAELDDWRAREDAKFEANMNENTEKTQLDLNGKKNTVL